MAKLYFRYGAMNSGKSTALLQAAFNYEERGQRVLLAKPLVDTKGDARVLSRLGVSREVDLLVAPDTDLFALMSDAVRGHDSSALLPDIPSAAISCLLVDEAQFLTPAQVDDLLRVTVELDIPVLAYGIRTDFQTRSFPGSRRLLEVAHSLEELKTICRCGRKAMFNGRRVGQNFVFDGEQVAIDGVEVGYESLCPRCYLDAGGSLPYRAARQA
ncbi:thymidine kinase [Schaalia sp. 19OD2882]|uniref:thymidine kinase n=1 Tax=Schaalia sp. 19OD2882 TaxID=2794089 RepID=UPI001C1ED858|nr:thymidine kinase [Schaalia sp. 19OD2882]QWW18792.1 thymidine kinase [Schaalia sp. 19OD2882]